MPAWIRCLVLKKRTRIFALGLLVCFLFMISLMVRLQRVTDQPLKHEGNVITEKPSSATVSHGHKIAILVPFRDRFEELLEFVPYMHNFLNKQGTAHQIYVINQVDNYRYVLDNRLPVFIYRYKMVQLIIIYFLP